MGDEANVNSASGLFNILRDRYNVAAPPGQDSWLHPGP